MEIIERNEDGVAVFVLSGRVDSSGAVELDDILHRAVADRKSVV